MHPPTNNQSRYEPTYDIKGYQVMDVALQPSVDTVEDVVTVHHDTHYPVTLLSSRFNNETWKENERYRTKHNTIGCIYGCPLRISSKALHVNASAYVLEMNNTTNRIEGVGVIRNYANFDQPPWIYQENNYNRYIYAGKYRMDRDELERYNTDLVDAIEAICFKGKTHLKRGAGLTIVPKKLLLASASASVKRGGVRIAHELRAIFRRHFRGEVETTIIEEGGDLSRIDPGMTSIVKMHIPSSPSVAHVLYTPLKI